MRVVIQCAGSKRPAAATFKTADGRRVVFVAEPALAPKADHIHYAHPDDVSDRESQTWRERVADQNRLPGVASSPLCPAGSLYTPSAYRTLQQRFGAEHLFILSAGWGLVRADFLLPSYDITFSASAEAHRRRRSSSRFADFNALAGAPAGNTVFLGGKDYLPLFLKLTEGIPGQRLVYFNSTRPPHAPGCILERYVTSRRTNWHYDCADHIATGVLKPFFAADGGLAES